MAEQLSQYDIKVAAQYRAHTNRLGESTSSQTQDYSPSADYTRKDLRRLGLAVEGDFSDVYSVSMSKNGESRQVDVTPYLVRGARGEQRTYFYPNEVLRNRSGR
jgi:hypothetical protein